MQFQGRKLRNEMKYYLHAFEYTSLRYKISTLLTMDRNSVDGDGYGIRSLYFDGRHEHSLYDKNNGIFKREKYRIRIYNGSDAKITVERKSKFGDYVCKEAAVISRQQYDAIIAGDYSALSDSVHPLLQDFYSALAYRAFRSVVIVDYIREAYVYEPGNVRITFDKRLAAGVNTIDLFEPDLVLEEALLAHQTIMEVKFDDFLPDPIRKLLQPEKHVRSAISKYVICREIGLKHFKT
ncbi:polyphosphate polymerase domain-containing protein [Paenibacillus harenae]|uniref:polyphosphate polymerase domain-containing protein n=1 Tax=Paenibacillus harenae TaxID=306543 RepID=UPI00040410CC|nr:polyphosphate polymerase domain-containing protein [Paenibacillus harenae]